MNKLSTEQLLYLLYAFSYSEEGTVTKSTIKELLSRDKKDLPKKVVKEDIERLYEALLAQNLIESPKEGRLLVTDNGIKTLVSNLAKTEYEFSSVKGSKVLNALKQCIELAFSSSYISSKELDFDTFTDKFKNLYFEERKRQERDGVVVIHKQDICEKFLENNPISQSTLNKYFSMLKSTGKIFTVAGKDDELVHWAE